MYAGIHGGFLNGNVDLSDDSSPGGGNISGSIGGFLAGYNLPNASLPFVLGGEVDFGIGQVSGNGNVCTDCNTNFFHYDFEWDAHVRARAGVPMGTFMPFVAGGLAFARLNITEGGLPLWNDIYTGGTVGAGVDAKFAPGWMGRAEVLYDFYPTQTRDDYTASISAFTTRVAVIFKLP